MAIAAALEAAALTARVSDDLARLRAAFESENPR